MTDDARRFTKPTIVLIIACLVLYLLGNAQVPLWDRDEPRYAQCSRQMLETGDWVLPRYLDELRMAKPPLIYWLQGAAMSVFGVNEGSARLPSALAMAATLVMVAVCVRRALSAEHAFWAVVVLGTSVLTIVAAKACLTDSVLLFFVTAAQFCLYAIWRGKGTWPVVVALGVAIGLTLLVKGPVGLGVHLMTFAAYGLLTWSLKWKKKPAAMADDGAPSIAPDSSVLPYEREPVKDVEPAPPVSAFSVLAKTLAVVGIVLAIGLPWVFAVERSWKALPVEARQRALQRGAEPLKPIDPDAGYVMTVLDREVFNRSANPQEGHKGPPGYYLASVWPTFMPWSLILPATLVMAWINRREVHVRFALAAVIGPWLMFEVVATKLPHYLLPCFVPLAVLAADGIVRCVRGASAALSDNGFRRGAIVWGVLLAAIGSAPWVLTRWFQPQPWPALVIVSLLAAGYAFLVVRKLWKRQIHDGLAIAGLGALLLYAILFRIYIPACDFLRISPKVAAVLREAGATKPGQVVMLDYKEPSLAFYQGGTIRENSSTVITNKLLEVVPAEYFVVTQEVIDASKPKDPTAANPLDKLEQVGEPVVGLDAADELRKVTVYVLRRK